MAIETVLYGIPKGETERYTEVLLLSNATPEKIAKVKSLAAKDGFHSFRVAKINLSVKPDFTRVVKDALKPVGSFTAQENANMAHFKSVQAHNLERIKKGLQPKSFHTYETPKVPAKDSARRARLHRALDAVMDSVSYPVPKKALTSTVEAKKFLESVVERMQSAYSKEEDARERYKQASSDQRRSRDLSAKWDAASAKVGEQEAAFKVALKTIQAAMLGFVDPT